MSKHKKINEDTAHRWAHHIGDYSETKGGRLYFSGDIIYSYGNHFPIARHVLLGKGNQRRRAILFTTRGYSVTTARHMTEVSRAIPRSETVFYVDNVRAGESGYTEENKKQHAHNLQGIRDNITAAVLKFKKARVNKDGIAGQIDHLIEQYNGYITFFKLRTKKIDSTDLDAVIGNLAEAAERARKNELAKQRRDQAAREKRNAEDIQKWLRGESNYFPGSVQRIYLRADHEEIKDWVSTSRGVQIPYDHAKKAFGFVKLCRDRGEGFHCNGRSIHVGNYTIDVIDPDGTVHAGCHHIQWSEIEDLARREGWFNLPPDATIENGENARAVEKSEEGARSEGERQEGRQAQAEGQPQA